MRWIASVGALLVAASAWAVDYDRIDRAILHEPVYQSGAPQYALLLFGPQAKRVWLVIDGSTAYVDRHADGDLTASDDRIDDFGDKKLSIEIAGQGASYVITRISKLFGETSAKHLDV